VWPDRPAAPAPGRELSDAAGRSASIRSSRPGTWPPRFVDGESDREALLVLSHLLSMTPRSFHALAWREGTARSCLEAVRAGGTATDTDRALAADVDPAEVRARLDRAEARMVVPGDDGYPSALLDLPDPPAWLFVRGEGLGRGPPAVAIVGSRTCTPYGREVTAELAGDLAAAGLTVVSGAARGIDAVAHEAVLGAGGRTVAVLGSGIDVAYPKSNGALIDRIVRSGAVVSEYPPGDPALPRRFPARNRIVAALGRGVIVVEGAERSGSLITAMFAGELGREVMAVPGPITAPLSAAPNGLIRDGGHLVASPDDVLGVLGLPSAAAARSGAEPSGPSEPARLPEEERRILARLPGSPVTVDVAASAAGVDARRALRALAALELLGLVRSEGGRYRRAAPVRSGGEAAP
jgi:DNA processing protein